MKNKIVEILEKHGINGFETAGGTDKATWHSYDGLYEEKLSQYIDKEVSLLEIGVQYGGSALLWHDFLPLSKLVFIDVRDQVHPNIWTNMDKNRYDYHIMDAFNEQSVNQLKLQYPEGFDIIIEDGPHTLESQIFTIKNYVPLLKEGGILIIEDIQNFEYGKTLIDSIGDLEHKSIEFVDLRHIKNRYDDLLIVVKK